MKMVAGGKHYTAAKMALLAGKKSNRALARKLGGSLHSIGKSEVCCTSACSNRGEGGRRTDEVNKNFHHTFLHKASLPCRAIAQRRLIIPAEFAETKTAAGRRRMWRTRMHTRPASIGWPLNTKFDVARLWSLK